MMHRPAQTAVPDVADLCVDLLTLRGTNQETPEQRQHPPQADPMGMTFPVIAGLRTSL